jgi:phage shock protein A
LALDEHLDQLERQRQETKRNIEELDRKMETVRKEETYISCKEHMYSRTLVLAVNGI